MAITIDTEQAHSLNSFSPLRAMGAGVDSVPTPAVPEIYTPANVKRMLQAGLGAVSYRLYTELSVQDWHWNPSGSFSEAGGQGYWTSDATAGATKAVDTFGYRLPHRGFTTDQGNGGDYSRLDDGDSATYWKSNPYLSERFTHEADALHPQWALVDLGRRQQVNAAHIQWAAPYAVQYEVQYWTGGDAIYSQSHGQWVTFPLGSVSAGEGGDVTLELGAAPDKVRYLRVWMTRSSNTCDTHDQSDPRNCAGYAIGELGFGTLVSGVFTDLVTHRPDGAQTHTFASSVDPWHSATDRVHGQEQPGLDTVFDSGITRGVPAMVPVPMLYSTPENAAAEIRYLEARGDKIGWVELGEEPDGEYVLPEDDAALYIQWSDALHAVDPNLKLGGPVFQSARSDVKVWPDASGETSWTKRFLAYLASHGHLADLSFFSFEHYPFASCGDARTQANLLREPGLVQSIMQTWRNDGLPAGTPIFITETNYSQNETDAAQRPAGAIWYADMMGSLLANGGAGGFYYEYEPIPLSRSNPCPGFGSYGLLLGDANYRAHQRLSQFYAAQVLTQDWAQPVDALHELAPVAIQPADPAVGAYALHRPDGRWSVLLVNRDLSASRRVTLNFQTGAGVRYLAGSAKQVTFGPDQYTWVEAGAKSHPEAGARPARSTVPGGQSVLYTLPKGSITVIGGRL